MHGVREIIRMPLIGFGTWQYNSSFADQAVVNAFGVGYRHVDTANVYKNQVGVGRALASLSYLNREDFFVTTKIPGGLNESATWDALEDDLKELQLDYVDLMLIHWPTPGNDAEGAKQRQQQWLTLEKWAKQGKARAIGVSHFCQQHLEDILSVATLPVALNQNQYHIGMAQDTQPRLHDKSYNEKHDIVYMSYSSLCGPCDPPNNKELITGDLVVGIGKRHNKTGAQVSLRWLVQQSIPVIPKTSNIAHMKDNFDLFSFELAPGEMELLSKATSPAETGTEQKPDDAQDCSFEEPVEAPLLL
jgi:diketogulonate reductase-like aldo/keto reductase